VGDFKITSGDSFIVSSDEESDKIIMDTWPFGLVVCEVTKKRQQGVGFGKSEEVNCHEMQFTIVKVIQPRKMRKKNGVKRGDGHISEEAESLKGTTSSV
jgi:hypothetical protein